MKQPTTIPGRARLRPKRKGVDRPYRDANASGSKGETEPTSAKVHAAETAQALSVFDQQQLVAAQAIGPRVDPETLADLVDEYGAILYSLYQLRAKGLAEDWLGQFSEVKTSSSTIDVFLLYLAHVGTRERIIAISTLLVALEERRKRGAIISEATLKRAEAALLEILQSGNVPQLNSTRVSVGTDTDDRRDPTQIGRETIPLWDRATGTGYKHFQMYYAALPLDKRPTMGEVNRHDRRLFEAMRQYCRYHERAMEEFFPREEGRRPGRKTKVTGPEQAALALGERRERERLRMAKRRLTLKNQPK